MTIRLAYNVTGQTLRHSPPTQQASVVWTLEDLRYDDDNAARTLDSGTASVDTATEVTIAIAGPGQANPRLIDVASTAGFAVSTDRARTFYEIVDAQTGERESLELNGAQELAKKLEKTSLAFAVKTGEGGKMFGAITVNDLHDKLVSGGFSIDKKRIHLHTPVKTLGKHTVKVKLHADVSVELGFDVVSENPIEVAAPEAKPAAKSDKK